MSSEPETRPTSRTSSMDGVRVAILTHRFEAIVRSMMNTLVRTGRSGVLNTGQDFSCCVFTAEHELLQVAESQPVHVLTGDLMTRAMTHFHPRLRRGDADHVDACVGEHDALHNDDSGQEPVRQQAAVVRD